MQQTRHSITYHLYHSRCSLAPTAPLLVKMAARFIRGFAKTAKASSGRIGDLRALRPRGPHANADVLQLKPIALEPISRDDALDCIIGIETSCDDTGVAVLGWRRPGKPTRSSTISAPVGSDGAPIVTIPPVHVLSDVLASQHALHSAYAGVVPHFAARAHEEHLPRVFSRAAQIARLPPPPAGAELSHEDGHRSCSEGPAASTAAAPAGRRVVAVGATAGPGLAMCLRAGLTAGEAAAASLGVPLIPINHLEGHLLVPRLVFGPSALAFPYLVLLVSGGHTLVVLARGVGDYQTLGGTRDDSLGECFDKVGRMLRVQSHLAALRGEAAGSGLRAAGMAADSKTASGTSGGAHSATNTADGSTTTLSSVEEDVHLGAPSASASEPHAPTELDSRAAAIRAALTREFERSRGVPITFRKGTGGGTGDTGASTASLPPANPVLPPSAAAPAPSSHGHLGAALEALALHGDESRVGFPIPMRGGPGPVTMGFSFSGLKSAVHRLIRACEAGDGGAPPLTPPVAADIAASFQRAATAHLAEQLSRALAYCDLSAEVADSLPLQRTRGREGAIDGSGGGSGDGIGSGGTQTGGVRPSSRISQVVVCGGVAANAYVRAAITDVCTAHGKGAVFPPLRYCTDNGVMIAWAATERYFAGLHRVTPAQVAREAGLAPHNGPETDDTVGQPVAPGSNGACITSGTDAVPAKPASGLPGAGEWTWDLNARWRLGALPPVKRAGQAHGGARVQ